MCVYTYVDFILIRRYSILLFYFYFLHQIIETHVLILIVSGFYAECPCKKMYCNGYIYTKSRFLGLSLGVHNIGEATLHLLEHDDEQYTVTLPSAYGRSVFMCDILHLTLQRL